jgi:hypothetical protein
MNNIWPFPTRKNNKSNHFQLYSHELYLEPINLGKRLYVEFRKHDREPYFGHGNTFDKGLPVV